MTIIDVIGRIDTLKPNGYKQSEKIKWLSELDSEIKKQIIDTHEGGENVVFNGYTDETPLTQKLLVEAPYDKLYLYWLESRIDYYDREQKSYNNSIDTFNVAYSEFSRYYNRTHLPKGKQIKLF